MRLLSILCLKACVDQAGALRPVPEAVVLPKVCEDEGKGMCSSNVALMDTALHSIQQELHQMRHVINFTKRHTCVVPNSINVSDSKPSPQCEKATVLMKLLKESEDVAAALDLDTYYFHRHRFSAREVSSLFLQGVGLLGATIIFGYLLYYTVMSFFFTGVLFAEILLDLPNLFAKAMFIPFVFIVVEIFFFGYFFVGSFSLVIALAAIIESTSFIFARNPIVLECVGVATIIVAMLSFSKPIGRASADDELGNDSENVQVLGSEYKHVAGGPSPEEINREATKRILISKQSIIKE